MKPERFVAVLALMASLLVVTAVSSAQTAERPSRITQPVDETNLTVLMGNTHPLARPEFDRGPAPAGLPMNRMLLLLSHTKGQEADANRLIEEQQNESSPNFHRWLKPEEYGERFGPSPEEIQSVTTWLESHGFQIAKVAKGRHVIEFSGTAAQVKEALHTEIHKYVVKGEAHWANASDPQIPAALAPVVSGVVSLHNFPRKSKSHPTAAALPAKSGTPPSGPVPLFSFPALPSSCNADSYCFGITPYDFAIIYNVKPLWDEGIDGTGQSIAIVADSNINIQDVRDYRKLFNLPPHDPQIILNGPDPGILVNSDEGENLGDTTFAGIAAKGATIKLVVSATTNTTYGIDLSSQYIIENNLAGIMTESYDLCELFQGTTGNQFYYTQWQQAAAQGITAFVGAGDAASADCDYIFNFFQVGATAHFGHNINGIASTPYNVAVGGTDFNLYSNPLKYWSLTNDPTTHASALSYIPETPWNDSCANPIFTTLGQPDVIANCNNPNVASLLNIPGFSFLSPGLVDTIGGDGGASSCTVSDGLNVSSCQGGYSKPAWQQGPGVPADGKRDIPDVVLFASSGDLTGAFLLFCELDYIGVPCNLNAPYTDIAGFFGTSQASPLFAGIMALVDQKTGSRQGNANYVFYKLAAEQSPQTCDSSIGPASTCIFNDITFGSNAVPCAPGSPDCVTEGNLPVGVLDGYNAGPGYDLTTGLGSVNSYNLVHKWKSIVLDPTSTSLSLSPSFITHGQPVGVNIAVTSRAGTPTGQVALLANNSPFTLNNQSDGDFTLGNNGMVSANTQLLPGGLYNVRAHYGGDGIFGQSDSQSVHVTVVPEPSTAVASVFLCGTSLNACLAALPTGGQAGTPFSTAPYGTTVFVRADVVGHSGFGNATGLIEFTDNKKLLPGDPYVLNTAASVSYYQPATSNTITPNGLATFAPGVHNIRAFYSGDSSFLPSASHPVSFTITQAQTQTALLTSTAAVTAGTSVTLTAALSTSSYGNAPTGTITFFLGATQIGSPVPVIGGVDPIAGTALATASFTTSGLPVGQDSINATYNGDGNYTGSVSAAVVVAVSP